MELCFPFLFFSLSSANLGATLSPTYSIRKLPLGKFSSAKTPNPNHKRKTKLNELENKFNIQVTLLALKPVKSTNFKSLKKSASYG